MYSDITKRGQFILEILLGKILGKAVLQKNGEDVKGMYIIKFECSEKALDYFLVLCSKLDELLLPGDFKRKERFNRRRELIVYYEVRTFPDELFTHLARLFIKKNNKGEDIGVKLKEVIMHKSFTERSLAHWFIDKGSHLKYNYSYRTNKRTLVLDTKSFEYADVQSACSAMNLKFTLKCFVSLDDNKPVIIIPSTILYMNYYCSSSYRFATLIKPYMHASMLYKLHPCLTYTLPEF